MNPDNEGIFVRVIVPSLGVQPSLEVLTALNEINATLPIGSFVFAESGEVRFKSAVFLGDAVAPEELLAHLFASAGDMVRAQFPRISRLLTGAAHTH
ncbi:MAG TPA: YbjN domain-containing protein [Thermoanaerobaculia bacterium]|nr:YbjN domain-containing protein [Thermoanaerobaculia bacterium]